MTIKLYNTCTGKKEDFSAREEGKVDMYVCGPTTYDYIHLGNARPLIVFDTVRRYFEYKGYEVNYVQNFTDIDDKIIKRALEENVDPIKLAEKYINEYFKDAKALGVKEATAHPKVSQHLGEIIEMIQGIVDNGYGYEVDGDVYFSVGNFENYGRLSGRSLEDMQAGARVEVDTRKRHPMDFALWKAAKPGEPAWDSPWGKGRPGWHIECSAMANKYLGMGFDIHGGGFDLIFPHHENEIAQAEAYAGCSPFARYWMHNGFITINEEKMSKSLGNFFTVREILSKYDPEVVRFYMLATHYRSPLDFDDTKLEMNKKSLNRLHNAMDNLRGMLKNVNVGEVKNDEVENKIAELLKAKEKAVEDFGKAMDDDFNTALAIAAMFDLARESNGFVNFINQIVHSEVPAEIQRVEEVLVTFKELGEVLGLFGEEQDAGNEAGLVDDLMQLIIDVRQMARKKKDWDTADQIRDRLNGMGIVIEDSPQGARWKKK